MPILHEVPYYVLVLWEDQGAEHLTYRSKVSRPLRSRGRIKGDAADVNWLHIMANNQAKSASRLLAPLASPELEHLNVTPSRSV